MIRKAVGAIVIKDKKVMLVHKVKIANTLKGKVPIKGQWDFVKGGVETCDRTLEDAVLRELWEETGSKDYRIIKRYEKPLVFHFSSSEESQVNFTGQETTMFLVEYCGDINKLMPQDDEIDQIIFKNKDEVLDILYHEDTKNYYLSLFPF